ncbi:MAG: 4-(cytidine 5'-diphospho)-2-C-methyl-D-erythritol kinase [Candidatus Enteromonas sp.]|nr:4-(cytidine 5'-diphospho)-2-C-methyl-D-erythritol kinase [Candidatus Enteromonas sp.]
MNIKSYAKINVSLKVVGILENGYHDLEMVNLPLDLHDVITIDPLPIAGDTYITCNDLRLVSMKGNLCTRALEALRSKYGFKDNFRISIHKCIPFAAGLGGGSSNAAVVLQSINKMLRLGASKEELAEIGLSLGADVPYFLNPVPAIVRGIGESITPVPMKDDCYCLIVKPEEGLSTSEIYRHSDEFPKETINTAAVVEGLAEGNFEKISANRGNDLYPAAKALLPVIERIVTEIKDEGFAVAAMSGSGSACFGLTKDHRLAIRAERRFIKEGYIVRLCRVLRNK